jgi:hypothetical protein
MLLRVLTGKAFGAAPSPSFDPMFSTSVEPPYNKWPILAEQEIRKSTAFIFRKKQIPDFWCKPHTEI